MISEWVLIIFFSFYGGMTSVDGFGSKDKCQHFANELEISRIIQDAKPAPIRAHCIPKRERNWREENEH